MPTRTWRRDARILLLTTLPFALVVGGLMLAAQSPWVGGWEPLTLVIYAVGVAALWAAMVVCYLVWIVIREGWQASSLPAAVLLVLIAAGAGAWGFSAWAEERACQRAFAFYGDLPALTAGRRASPPIPPRPGPHGGPASICGDPGPRPTPCAAHRLGKPGGTGLSDEERGGPAGPSCWTRDCRRSSICCSCWVPTGPDRKRSRLLGSSAPPAWLNARNPEIDWGPIPDGRFGRGLDRAGILQRRRRPLLRR